MTTRYEFKATHTDNQGSETVTIKQFDADVISEVLEEFREFLLGVGFTPETIKQYELLE